MALRRRKPRLLLAMLLLRNGRTVSTSELTTALWQDGPPPSARANLHAYVSTLRRQLGDAVLTTAGDGYRVQVESNDLDANLFERFVAEARAAARTGRPKEAVRLFTGALHLWRGDVLENLELTKTLHDESVGLRELRLSAEDELMDAQLETDEATDVVAEFRKLVRAEPFRERRWGRLMVALHRCGRGREALETYQELYALLDSELGIGPCTELRALHGQLIRAAAADCGAAIPQPVTPAPPQPRWRGPRPHITVVGRHREKAELAGFLLHDGLVTVTGPGGCGKSTLALATAGMMDGHFTNGVTVIGPAETRLMTNLDAPPGPDSGQRTLVVLDDCEHLPGSAAHARRLLSQPGTSVLATSRAPLRISGEVTWPLGPLPTPETDERTAATRLFVRRAAQATPGFRDDAESRALVASICRCLDGLPLAIELAAARLRVLALPDLAERLDTGLACLLAPDLTASERHETLTSAFIWAYDRLDAPERVLLRHLAEWKGEFSLTELETTAVGGLHPGEVLHVLATLVEQSFVQTFNTPDGRRFRLLAPIRAFITQVSACEREPTAVG